MRRTFAVVLAAVALTLGMTSSASADWRRFPDPVDDVAANQLNVDRTTVAYNDLRARVTLHFTNLTPDRRGDAIAYFKTRQTPAFGLGLVYDLRSGHVGVLSESTCRRATVERSADAIRFQIPARCLDGAPSVRVLAGVETSRGEDWTSETSLFLPRVYR